MPETRSSTERLGGPSLTEARAEATRNAILDGAERLFAENGYAGTSMRLLAQAARTSQALLHHHFGTKAQLYEAVKRRFTERFNVEHRARFLATEPNLAAITRMVLGYFEFLGAHPALSRLSAWARLEGNQTPLGGEDEIWRSLGKWVEQAKSSGLFRDEVDPKFFMVLGAAVVQFWFDNRAFMCAVLDLDPNDKTLDERYVRHALDVLLFGATRRA